MIKKLTSIFLLFITTITMSGCGQTPLAKQAEIMAKELSKKPANKYSHNVEKNGVYIHVDELNKHKLKQYYAEAGSSFYDVYFVAVTNKSNKNIVLSVPDTAVLSKTGKKRTVGNNLKCLMKKGDDNPVKSTFSGAGKTLLTAMTFGLASIGFLAQGEPNNKQKTKEIYYQTTYDKGLQSVVLAPYKTAVGFMVLPDKPFHSYKAISFKFQKTQELAYFDIDYPMELTNDKLDNAKKKAALKEAEKKRKQELKLLKQKHKNL